MPFITQSCDSERSEKSPLRNLTVETQIAVVAEFTSSACWLQNRELRLMRGAAPNDAKWD